MVKVWFDCEGHDDAYALLAGLYTPGIEIIGVSTVHGNATIENTTSNAARCLVGFKAPASLKVNPGASKAILRPLPFVAANIHGNDGLGGVKGLPDFEDPSVIERIHTDPEQHVIPALHAKALELKAQGERMVLVATGPFSNVAIFLLAYPELAHDVISEIVVMGGAFDELGNSNPSRSAEWNVYADPEAAQVLFKGHHIPVKVFPLDITHKAIFRHDVDVPRMTAKSSPIRTILETIAAFFASTYKDVFGFDSGPPVHDLLTMIYLVRPELFSGAESAVEVDLLDPHRGRTRRVEDEALPKAWIATDLAIDSLWDVFFEAVERAEVA